MNLPKKLKYTEEHEWLKNEEDLFIVGITDYAQGELGDIVFVELPVVDDKFDKSEPFGTVEAVKTVSDLYMPISGTVVEINTLLEDNPDLINTDPYGEGWIIKFKANKNDDIKILLDSEQYKKIIS
tara:strand:+ start:225 stop:602 length:378 start_codon:yes stop_codon:yes gene_type:complete